jgi:hypothetical protein
MHNRSAAPGAITPTLVYADVGAAIAGCARCPDSGSAFGMHRWTFSQAVADVAPEEWGGVPPGPGETR